MKKNEKLEFHKLKFHPGLYRALYRSYWRQILIMALGGLAWSLFVFLLSIQLGHQPRHIVLYSYYAALHSLYIILGLVLTHILLSRAWMRAAALAAVFPGPGFLFSLVQIYFAIRIFHALGHPRWEAFFAWRMKTSK